MTSQSLVIRRTDPKVQSFVFFPNIRKSDHSGPWVPYGSHWGMCSGPAHARTHGFLPTWATHPPSSPGWPAPHTLTAPAGALRALESCPVFERVQSGHLTKLLPARWHLCGTYKGQPLSVDTWLHSAPSGQMDPQMEGPLMGGPGGGRVGGRACGAEQDRDPPATLSKEPWSLTEGEQPPAFIKLLQFNAVCQGQAVGRSLGAVQHSSVGLGEVTNASYILLQAGFPAWRWRGRGGGGGGRRVRFPRPLLLPAPKPSISPRLTCETQGWEPQRYSVTKSRFIGT